MYICVHVYTIIVDVHVHVTSITFKKQRVQYTLVLECVCTFAYITIPYLF